jgi:hypothetical protein
MMIGQFGCGSGADFQAFLNRLGLVLKSECHLDRPERWSPVQRASATLEPFQQKKTCGGNRGLRALLRGIASHIADNLLGHPSFYHINSVNNALRPRWFQANGSSGTAGLRPTSISLAFVPWQSKPKVCAPVAQTLGLPRPVLATAR